MTLSRQVIEPKNPPLDQSRKFGLPLSPAIRGGDFVFISGMAAIDPATGERAHGTVAAETRQILTNMGELLEAAGSSLVKVIKVNVLIYSMLEYENMNSVYREFFPVDPPAFFYYAAAAERSKHYATARQALLDLSALQGDDADAPARTAHIELLSKRMTTRSASAR